MIAHVSESDYHKWLHTADEPDSDYEDYHVIKELFDRGRAKHGIRTITMKLRAVGGLNTFNIKEARTISPSFFYIYSYRISLSLKQTLLSRSLDLTL